MKKSVALLFGILFLSVFLIGVVSAAQSPKELIQSVSTGVYDLAKPLAETLLGTAANGEYLFAKVLLLIMLVGICFSVLGNISFFKEKKPILWILSIGVGVLAIRWLTEGMVQSILLPYTTLGIVVAAGLPFLIFFFLVNVGLADSVPTVRRIAWIFFGVVFFGLWVFRVGDIPGNSIYMYPVVGLLALIMAFMDGTISRFFEQVKQEGKLKTQNYGYYAKLIKEYNEATEALSAAKVESPPNKDKIERLKSLVGRLHQAMVSFRSGSRPGDELPGGGNLWHWFPGNSQ